MPIKSLLGQRKFTFVNYGGAYQLRIDRAEDLEHLDELDDPFWMATSAPIDQMQCDAVALELLDVNENGRIISSELRRTRRWLFRVLRNLEGVTERREVLSLDDLDPSEPEGALMIAAARRILANLDRPDAPTITLADVRNTKAILAKGAVNGDGVLPPSSVEDPELRGMLQDIVTTMGSRRGVSGEGGVDAVRLSAFLQEARAYLDWHAQVSDDASEQRGRLLVLGGDTTSAHALLQRLQAPIDRYFKLCESVRLNESLGRPMETVPSPDASSMSDEQLTEYLRQAPIAPPNAELELRLAGPLNPFYAEDLEALLKRVVVPLHPKVALGKVLRRSTWLEIIAAFGPFRRWLDDKAGAAVEPLGPVRLRRYVDGDAATKLRALMDRDLEVGKELAAMRDLERVVLMQRWFLEICNNFISFKHMYDADERAIFEIGRLVIDGRIFNFNLRVRDLEAHRARAARSGMFLLYSEVTAGPGDEPFHMVTPVTSRDRGNLGVDKRGVLVDLEGRQWEVRVVAVVENPISFGEAITAPFKRVTRAISSAVDRMSKAAEKQLDRSLEHTTAALEKGVGSTTAEATQVATITAEAPEAEASQVGQAPAAAESEGTDRLVRGTREMLLTGGVAVAALGSSLAFIAKTLADLQLQRTLLAIGIALAVTVAPIAFVAMLKLYQRNLSSILEASGWAINENMRLTRSLAQMLAPDPVHPDSFERISRDLIRHALRARRRDAKGSSS